MEYVLVIIPAVIRLLLLPCYSSNGWGPHYDYSLAILSNYWNEEIIISLLYFTPHSFRLSIKKETFESVVNSPRTECENKLNLNKSHIHIIDLYNCSA